MQKRQILINAIMSVMQIIITSGVLFILYRFLLNVIGAKQLGIWSVVLATTSVTQIANLGLSGSVVKFVAKYIARGEEIDASKVIQTACLSIGVFVGIILITGFPILRLLLGIIIPAESLPLALAILPFAIFALWLMVITSVFQAGLDGYQRIDLRSLLLMGGGILHLFLCFLFAPNYGLIGIAYARVIQNFVMLLCSWFLLKRYLRLLPLFPYKWDKRLFREIIGYGINFQIISVAAMCYDPITKALLSKFGGLSAVGYYEMASRMIQQFRALIISANQVLIPSIADLKERTPEKLQPIYLKSYQLVFYLALPLYSIVIISIPIISEIWIGHYESTFVAFGILLSIGWFLNTLAGPAYFANLGIGRLRWNVASHIVIAILNVGLGYSLGQFYDGIGVVIAWVFSLGIGSSVIYLSYHIEHKIALAELFPQASRMVCIVCAFCILSIFIINYQNKNVFDTILIKSIMIMVFSIVIFIPVWLHPIRKRLIMWINSELIKR